MSWMIVAFVVLIGLPVIALAADAGGKAEIVDVRRIWNKAPHNAFTDLIRFKGRWYCAFREGQAHASPDGSLRVLRSEDGQSWQSVAHITSETGDLRDAKLSITAAGQPMLNGGEALHQPAAAKHQSLTWFSADGQTWGQSHAIGDPDFWIWSVTWHEQVAYGVGYRKAERRSTRLYRSRDGRKWEVVLPRLLQM